MREEKTLMEIGPRFVMNIISVFAGSFGGEILYKNPDYVTPNQVCFSFGSWICLNDEIRRMNKMKKAKPTYDEKAEQRSRRAENKMKWAPQKDILDDVFSAKEKADVDDFMDEIENFGQ